MKWRPSFTRTAIIEKDMAMNRDTRTILEEVRAGTLSVEDACLEFKQKPFADIGYAKVDLHRRVRQGVPEIIYGAGKTPEQIIGILQAMKEGGEDRVLITRLSEESAKKVSETMPISYYREARVGILGGMPQPEMEGTILIATGGTGDMSVSPEVPERAP